MATRHAVPQRLLFLCCAVLTFSTALFLTACGMGPRQGPPDTTNPSGNAPANEPPPLAPGVNILSPANGATVVSPMKIQVQTNIPNPVDHAQVFIDGKAVYWGHTPFNTLLWMNPGQHKIDVTATDSTGAQNTSSTQVNVQSQTDGLPAIQDLPYWNSCTATILPPDPRAGQPCASGLGNATFTLTQHQSTPSMSGSSAQFSIGGATGYSNALWWNSLGGGADVSHFSYDMYLYIDHPEVSQALEFDVNQAIDTTRYTWGTECNFKGTGTWDIWNGATQSWVQTTAPCTQLPANQWIHLVWTFERINGMARYVSVQVDDKTYPINTDMPPQLNWKQQDIDVAFQMDGDYAQHPYNVWIDNFVLRAK